MGEETKSAHEPKSFAITMVLAVVLGGFGHVYLGFVKKGLIIFAIGLGLGIGLSWWLGWFGSVATLAFWIWQIIDAYKTYRRMYPKAS